MNHGEREPIRYGAASSRVPPHGEYPGHPSPSPERLWVVSYHRQVLLLLYVWTAHFYYVYSSDNHWPCLLRQETRLSFLIPLY